MSISPAGLSEFHQNFFILLNLAVGGIWPGNPDETTVFPQTLEVDFVRVFNCGTVSFESHQHNENISVYPIPSEDIVHIGSKSKISGYTLSDLKGRNIFNSGNTNQNNINIHIGKQPPGIYLLQVRTSDGSSHFKKLVKLDHQK
jgi:beta-glucanase (GH16 family)